MFSRFLTKPHKNPNDKASGSSWSQSTHCICWAAPAPRAIRPAPAHLPAARGTARRAHAAPSRPWWKRLDRCNWGRPAPGAMTIGSWGNPHSLHPLTVTTNLPIISAVAWGVRSQPEHCQLLVESMFMIIPGENRDVPAVGLEEAPKGHELLAGSSMKFLSSRWPQILVNHRKFGVA